MSLAKKCCAEIIYSALINSSELVFKSLPEHNFSRGARIDFFQASQIFHIFLFIGIKKEKNSKYTFQTFKHGNSGDKCWAFLFWRPFLGVVHSALQADSARQSQAGRGGHGPSPFFWLSSNPIKIGQLQHHAHHNNTCPPDFQIFLQSCIPLKKRSNEVSFTLS